MPYVDVWVDVADCIDDLSDDEIRKEYRKRFHHEPDDDGDLVEAIERIERGDVAYGLYLLRQIVSPKFPSLELCLKEYAKAKGKTP